MDRGFVRVLWGVYQDDRWHRHRIWLDNQLRYLKLNSFDRPFTALVFGEENFKQLVDMGFNCRLVDKRPVVWDMEKEQFRHKLEALKIGMQLFDEMVFLDWDTQPIQPLPDNFWQRFYEKDDIQISLRWYFRRRITWRTEDARKVPCAAFIYMRNKNIPGELIKIWEELGRPWTEEQVLMKYIDNRMDGWKGEKEYLRRFEPIFFNLEGNNSVFLSDPYKAVCFEHVTKRKIKAELKSKGFWVKNKSNLSPEALKNEKIERRKGLLERQERRRLRTLKRLKRMENNQKQTVEKDTL